MTHKLTRAVAEAGPFIAAHQNFSGDREVICVTPFSAGMPSLTLGSVRAMYELAAEFQAIFAEYTPEEVARALAR